LEVRAEGGFSMGVMVNTPWVREFIDYKTSMITYEDPLRGLLFY